MTKRPGIRERERHGTFMRRTRQQYETAKKRGPVEYTLAEYRERAAEALAKGECVYCGVKLVVGNFSLDHDFPNDRHWDGRLSRVSADVCVTCNTVKGPMCSVEFERFMSLLEELSSDGDDTARKWILSAIRTGAKLRTAAYRRSTTKRGK